MKQSNLKDKYISHMCQCDIKQVSVYHSKPVPVPVG
jgi:hypothetical protein